MTDDYGHADVYRGRIEVTAWCLSPWIRQPYFVI